MQDLKIAFGILQTVLKAVLILGSVWLIAANARAEVVVDSLQDGVGYFIVDGHKVSPADASIAAEKSNAKIIRCTIIKDAMTDDGKPARKCKQVVKHINPKNGNSTWKNL
jgi:hypothetical protein